MRCCDRWIVVVAGLAAMLISTTAAAQERASEVLEAQSSSVGSSTGGSDFRLQIAAGMRGGIAGVAGHGFENDEFVVDNNGDRIPGGGQWGYPEYYGHFGVGGTGGLSLDIRFNGFVGVELGLFYSQDNATGYVDKNHATTGTTIARIHSEQRTTAYHIPVLLKFNIPSDFVRPFIAVGLQYVVQVNSELEYTQEEQAGRYGNENAMDELNERNQIEPTNYPLLAGSAGVEVVVGPVRIPVELRLGYALGYDQAMQERAYGQDGQIIYDGVYLGHFGVFSGVLYEFDLLQ